jgi:septal ring factor EnvC (AmiA/AmiB activator)
MLLMYFRLEQDTLASEYKSKIMEINTEIELEKKKSCDTDSELQREEQTASELLGRLKEIRSSNSSMEQEVRDNCNSGLQAAQVVIL